MIAVLARAGDDGAGAVVRGLPADGVLRIAPADLSAPGWRLTVPDGGGGGLAAGGRRVAAAELTGVLNRLPGVGTVDLAHVATADRPYVAAEMTAFLRAWLGSLAVPILNGPTPTSLSGPAWSPEQWTRAAASAGLPIRVVRRRVPDARPGANGAGDGEPDAVATVVGERCLGDVHPRLRRGALRLAHAAGAGLLELRFAGRGSGAVFTGATPWPVLMDAATAAAVAEQLGVERGG